MDKRAVLLVAVLAFSSLILVESASAQSIPKPSVPEFYLKLVDHSYDVPSSTTTTTDPYTGTQTITTHPGYHVDNKTIEVTVRNQPFTPYWIDDQHAIYLFYNVSYKGHYAIDWSYHPSSTFGRDSPEVRFLFPSTSDYTIVQFKAPTILEPTEGQMDFRIQAQIGYYTEHQSFVMVPGAPFTTYTFVGEVSGWSNTQTIDIPASNSSSSSSSTSLAPIQIAEPAPTVPTETSRQKTETPAQTPGTSVPNNSPSQNSTTTPNQQNPTQQDDQTLSFNWTEIVTFTVVGVVVALLIVVIALLRRRVKTLERKIGNSELN